MQSAQVGDEHSHRAHSPFSLDSDMDEDQPHTGTQNPANVIRRQLVILSTDDIVYTGKILLINSLRNWEKDHVFAAGANVSPVFEKQVHLELMFSHELDEVNTDLYVVEYLPQENSPGNHIINQPK